MTFDVFISYASSDREIAENICAQLEVHGLHCWIAPRDIVPGGVYSESILNGIDAVSTMIVILSRNSNTSTHVRNEVERAASKRKAIITVRIERVIPSKSLELFVMSSQWIEAWQSNCEHALVELAKSLLSARAKGALSLTALGEGSTSPRVAPSHPDSESIFADLVDGAWADGFLSDSERCFLIEKARDFKILAARALEIMSSRQPKLTSAERVPPASLDSPVSAIPCEGQQTMQKVKLRIKV